MLFVKMIFKPFILNSRLLQFSGGFQSGRSPSLQFTADAISQRSFSVSKAIPGPHHPPVGSCVPWQLKYLKRFSPIVNDSVCHH